MKKNWIDNIFKTVAALLILFLLAACNKDRNHTDHADVYTCPMHPTVISDKPGACPVCGMDLVKKAKPGEEVKITDDLSKLMKSPNQSVVSSIKTIRATFKAVPVSVEATGIVTYDTRNIYTIPARVGGRIEKMFVKYEFQKVRKGQKIAEIYSPELITAQRELLYLMQHDSTNRNLIDGATRKLELLGVSVAHQKDLMKQQQPVDFFAVYSPYDGYAIVNEKGPSNSQTMRQSSSTAAQMDGMGGSSAVASTSSDNSAARVAGLLREGNYVTVGQTLVKLVNTSALRIELDLPGAQTGMINVGDKIELRLGSDKTAMASVDFVQPFMNQNQNFIKLRVFISDINDVYIGQLVHANIKLKSKESLWIPKEAVLDLGNDKVAFVKDRGVLKPKKIQTGMQTRDLIEVIYGLSTADEIAFNAKYLVDSESFIRSTN